MNGICHVEFPCKDLEKIGKFYAAVFGWEVSAIPEMNYATYKAPDGPGGGFNNQIEITVKPGVLVYIEVEDIEDTLKAVEENGGGKVRPKTQISPEHGYIAIFKDIEGNSVGLWAKS